MFHRIFLSLAFFTLLALSPLTPAAGATGFLHRQHTQIVDGTGQPVHLRGVNLGNWLYPEPWMTGNTPFAMFAGEDGKPDEWTAAITDLVGPEKAAAFSTAWRDIYLTQPDIAKIAKLGFNSVRVPLDYRLFYDPATGKDVDTGFGYIDRLLGWCAASKVSVILDMHSIPGGKLIWVPGNIYVDPKKQAVLAHVWSRIAARYKDNSWVGGYDLINEPAVWSAPKLSAIYKTLIAAVRAEDKNHLVIVEGDLWGSHVEMLGMTAPGDVWDDNLALSNHEYGGSLAKSLTADAKKLAAQIDVPLWMGEFGYNSNTWDRRLRDDCEKADPNAEGWCFWAYKSTAMWGLTSFELPDSYRKLQDYWKKNPNAPKPSPEDAWAALTALASAAALPRCTVRTDVVDALTRPDFLNHALPVRAGVTIPGRIIAVDYDLGAEGVAYHDTVSTDEAQKGPAGRFWNDGWRGRNDGVDLYSGSADSGAPTVIGGIQPGEWVDYTLRATPGTYRLQIHYASPAGGALRLSLGGKDLTGPITLPATGGWDKPQTLTVPAVQITHSGPTTLRLLFDSDGFNIAWVEFLR